MADGLESRAKSVFDEAVELAPAGRAAFLDRACLGDQRLRARVEVLLAGAEADDAFLRDPTLAGGMGATARPQGLRASELASESPGTAIGPYKLLELIGEGGFGRVYLAEQREPVARRVALKIIKIGMDTAEVVARFEQERQALALMDHPNIAKVLDAGATPTGRPYFVMEHVKGMPVTQYCERNKLGVRPRLELFIQTCQAVQHAHTKGIIHRDLKPTNILITSQDGVPQSKVIDFGIAKATDLRISAKTVYTGMGQFIGTPEYMSPEQAEGSPDIDTRSDIYALGVLLYELLTGATPFDSTRLRNAAYVDVQRLIREVEPIRPSTRVSQSAPPGIDAAKDRLGDKDGRGQSQDERRARSRLLRGDLDWIVMKALEKDRTRRYDTATGLAADIRRHMAGEAVLAAPPSRVYRVRKFVRRNRGSVIAAGLVTGALVLGLAGTGLGLWRTELARAAEARQRQSAEKIAEFMQETLAGVEPSVARGRDTAMLKEMMDGAAEKIEAGELRDSPEAEVRLRRTIGGTYAEIAEFEGADRMLSAAVGLARKQWPGDHDDVAACINDLAWLRTQHQGRPAEAEALDREALAMRQRLHPGDHPDVAFSLNNLARTLESLGRGGEAEPLFREALAMKQRLFQGDHPDVANGLNNLGKVVLDQGRAEEAEPLYREALAMRRRLFKGDHPMVSFSMLNHADVLRVLGRPEESEALLIDAVAMMRRLYEGDHPETARALNNLAATQLALGRGEEAVLRFREAAEMRVRVFEGDHPDVAVSLNNLGGVLMAVGRPREAEEHLRRGLGMYERLIAGDYPPTANCMTNLARCLGLVGKHAEAMNYAQRAVEMAERILPEGHPIRQKCAGTLEAVKGMATKGPG